MSEVLRIDRMGIVSDGPTLSMNLSQGQSMAVVGPGGSGKSRFLRTVTGQEKPVQGTVVLREDVTVPGVLPKRQRVQSLARQHPEAATVLAASGLLEEDGLTIGSLSPSQTAAAELASVLSVKTGVLALDGYLDRLDPWALRSVLDRLKKLGAAGVCLIAATHRPDLLSNFDYVVVLVRREVRFAGTYRDLIRLGTPRELRVETLQPEGVRALVEPFEVEVTIDERGTRLQTREGQETAARLLMEGYGNVRLVIHRPSTADEALRTIR